jgi:hypothetical protein
MRVKPECTEGPKALENFERFATAVMQPAKPTKKGKQKDKPNASLRKPKSSDIPKGPFPFLALVSAHS